MAWGKGLRNLVKKRRHSTIYEDKETQGWEGFYSPANHRKEFSKNPDVVVHASSTSRLFEMLNSKTSKSDRKIGLGVTTNGGCRSLNDIMTELNSSIASLDSTGQSEDNSSLFEGSSYTTGGSMTGGSMTESMAELASEDMITALRAQRAQLLERRAEMQMRIIHLENDEAAILTGQRVHQVADWSRKHVNTGFSINNPTEGISSMDEVSQLEFDVEIQKKIVHAARRLAREHGIRSKAKRERKMATQRALLKLQELERKLQCAKRFQRPQPNQLDGAVHSNGVHSNGVHSNGVHSNGVHSNGHSDKLLEHQTYYKAVADNGYYPRFRKTRTTSSNSDDKGSSSSDLVESDGSSLPTTPLISSSPLTSSLQSSPHSSNPHITTVSNSKQSSNSSRGDCQDSVRACLQMSLNSDTKTLPRKRLDSSTRYHDNRHCVSQPQSPTTTVPDNTRPFTPCAVTIDNLTTRCQDNMNISSTVARHHDNNTRHQDGKYDKYRPRAGSFRVELADNMVTMTTVATRYHDNNALSDNIHSYDKYLQTLRQNRQRNNGHVDCNRNYESARYHDTAPGARYHDTTVRRQSLECYESAGKCSGQLNISTVSTHSTVV